MSTAITFSMSPNLHPLSGVDAPVDRAVYVTASNATVRRSSPPP
ncbi:Uncharacterised protein [Mycobacterium tuberculosis]|nr:Uncharacterised protein [Mycobacterium tuberculosis]